jgi:hypothetical protein
MATYENDALNAVAECLLDLLDTASGPGTIVFEESDATAVATCTCSNPCYTGSAAAGVLSFDTITSGTATGNAIAKVSFYDSDSKKWWEATIATDTSQEIQIGNLQPSNGATVGIDSLDMVVT